MATYIIGDIHGCLAELTKLLTLIEFNPTKDALYCTGDLINGGPKPVEVILLLKKYNCISVLGNHDLTLLAIAANALKLPLDKKYGFELVLNHEDCSECLAWIKQQPLMHYISEFNTLLVHAGIASSWDLQEALLLDKEATSVIRGKNSTEFFHNMMGNIPNHWDPTLTGTDRIRAILNITTRMRYCNSQGHCDFKYKGTIANAPADLIPWYKLPNRKNTSFRIAFGHWSALEQVNIPNLCHLDTGCVWGGSLSALRLEDNKLFQVASSMPQIYTHS